MTQLEWKDDGSRSVTYTSMEALELMARFLQDDLWLVVAADGIGPRYMSTNGRTVPVEYPTTRGELAPNEKWYFIGCEYCWQDNTESERCNSCGRPLAPREEEVDEEPAPSEDAEQDNTESATPIPDFYAGDLVLCQSGPESGLAIGMVIFAEGGLVIVRWQSGEQEDFRVPYPFVKLQWARKSDESIVLTPEGQVLEDDAEEEACPHCDQLLKDHEGSGHLLDCALHLAQGHAGRIIGWFFGHYNSAGWRGYVCPECSRYWNDHSRVDAGSHFGKLLHTARLNRKKDEAAEEPETACYPVHKQPGVLGLECDMGPRVTAWQGRIPLGDCPNFGGFIRFVFPQRIDCEVEEKMKSGEIPPGTFRLWVDPAHADDIGLVRTEKHSLEVLAEHAEFLKQEE